MALNNNQISAVLTEAVEQSTGKTGIDTLTLQNVIDNGNDPTVIGTKEQFTKSLCNVLIKNFFEDRSYRRDYVDPFFIDTEEYGAIIQSISIEVPEAQSNSAWQEFISATNTPVGSTPTELGKYLLYLPIVHTQLYGKTVSWQIPVAVTDEQWDTAFKSASELRSFIEYVFMCIGNAIVDHMESLDMMNRNHFIAEKFAYAESDDAVGVHVVNLVEEYAKDIGAADTSMTAEEFLKDKLGLLFASEKFRLFKSYFSKPSRLFNTAGRKRRTSDDMLVLQVISAFAEKLNTVALSDTYHKDIVELPLYQAIPYWQGTGEGYSWDEVTSIDIQLTEAGEAFTRSGIVAFMADKYAIMHTIKSRRTAQVRFDPEAITQYYNQFRDNYSNNLTMSAVVFVVQDYTAPAAA